MLSMLQQRLPRLARTPCALNRTALLPPGASSRTALFPGLDLSRAPRLAYAGRLSYAEHEPWQQRRPNQPQPLAAPGADFEQNIRRTQDVLRDSYPKLFSVEPDLSIYRPDIEFIGFHNMPTASLKGPASYRRRARLPCTR